MFDSLRARINIPKAIGVIGTVYMVRKYVSDRFEDVKEQMEQERTAKDKCVPISLLKLSPYYYACEASNAASHKRSRTFRTQSLC